MSIDPLTDFDWAAHWRELVAAREREVPVDVTGDFWAPIAPRLRYNPDEAADDPVLKVMLPFLDSRKTAIDAGAGAGRHTIPLAERLDWVTAVEPSEAMRALIPQRDNLTVVAATWEDADVAPADLVLCANVLYFVPEPVTFIEKLDAAARERVFVVMRDREMLAPGEQLYRALTGRPRTRMPQLYDLWNLLRSLGRDADVATYEYEVHNVYADFEEAVAESRHRIGAAWREEEGRAWLQANLRPEGNGTFSYGGRMVAGVTHWRPRT